MVYYHQQAEMLSVFLFYRQIAMIYVLYDTYFKMIAPCRFERGKNLTNVKKELVAKNNVIAAVQKHCEFVANENEEPAIY